jgi:hypothetical protein
MTNMLLSLTDMVEETYLKPERIQAFIRRQAESLMLGSGASEKKALSGGDAALLFHVMEVLPLIGIEIQTSEQPLPGKVSLSSNEEIQAWVDHLEGERILHKGIAAAGGASMLWKMLLCEQRDVDFLEKNLEVILRHVEVKRKHALLRYTGALTSAQIWQERCGYALVFSLYALIRQDWRFLNAALKLNEWLWKEFHSPFTTREVLPLLASLAEQEYAFQELQKCCA